VIRPEPGGAARCRPTPTRPPGRALALIALLAAAIPAPGAEGDRPAILRLALPARLPVGVVGNLRVVFRAPRGDVVALVVETEDLDGVRRATRQREVNVLARVYGRESGDLVAPLWFATPGRKRVSVSLVTESREASEPAEAEMDATP
jgi:hypothetical protein